MNHRYALYVIILILIPIALRATTVDELNGRIQDKTNELGRIDAEISATESLVAGAGKEAATLKKTLSGLDATRKRLQADINVTKTQISATQGTIRNLNDSITEKNKQLNIRRNMVGETVRLLQQSESNSPVLVFLGYASLGQYWSYAQGIEQLQKRLTASIEETKQLTTELGQTKSVKENEEERLTNYSEAVIDKKKIADATSQEKSKLLADTKSKEQVYQKLLADKQKEREAIEAELLDYESQLHFTLDPTTIPIAGTKVLRWPTISRAITQYFGNTEFSRSRAGGVYNGKGHNGIDIGISTGTELYAAQDGVVRGLGNTDIACPSASYGKWILIDHPTLNVSTLYAHLSLQKVSVGENVKAGDLIGYSGRTGYATGPHLHFSVFASKGVSITNLQSRVRGCGRYTLPVASFNSYLNPIEYLP